MIVMKFGGTSVGSPDRIRTVAEIVRARLAARPLVVVSAHAGVTDLLLEVCRDAVAGKNRVAEVRKRHRQIASGLEVSPEAIEPLLDDLAALVRGITLVREATPRTVDCVASFGERLSCRTVAAHLKNAGVPAVPVDAWDLGMVTDNQFTRANPLQDDGTTARLVAGYQDVIVTTGFIGRTAGGEITTLGRGGSDYSASLFGERIHAEEIQIWTDVDGVMSADPRIVAKARLLEQLSFEEASELAYYGAKVLHPATIVPAVKKNIPVRVLNTYRPESRGTVILREGGQAPTVVKSIAHKKGIHLVHIVSLRMLQAHGFLARIFDVFDRHQIVIDMVATSEVSVSVTTDSDRNLDRAIAELRQFAEVEHRPKRTILCVVGFGLREAVGVPGAIFTTLGEAGVTIEMISQGSTRINIALLIRDEEAERAVQALHAKFFG